MARAIDKRCFCLPETLPGTFHDPFLKLFRLFHDKIISLCHLRRMAHFFIAGIRFPETDIVRDRSAKQDCFLRHITDCFAQLIEIIERTSRPLIETPPSLTSKNAGSGETSVDLPLPVEPIKAIVSPLRTVKLTSLSTASSPVGIGKCHMVKSDLIHLMHGQRLFLLRRSCSVWKALFRSVLRIHWHGDTS